MYGGYTCVSQNTSFGLNIVMRKTIGGIFGGSLQGTLVRPRDLDRLAFIPLKKV